MDLYQDIPDELIIEQALKLKPVDIAALSQTSTRFNRLCNNDGFWRQKYFHDFGHTNWKALYQSQQLTTEANDVVFNGKSHDRSIGIDAGKLGNVILCMGLFDSKVYSDIIIGYTDCETCTLESLKNLANYIVFNFDPFDEGAIIGMIGKIKRDDHLVIILEELMGESYKLNPSRINQTSMTPQRWDAIKCYVDIAN